jgi:hypothetical protein
MIGKKPDRQLQVIIDRSIWSQSGQTGEQIHHHFGRHKFGLKPTRRARTGHRPPKPLCVLQIKQYMISCRLASTHRSRREC